MWSPTYWSPSYWSSTYWHYGLLSGIVVKVNGQLVLPGGTAPITSIALGDTFTLTIENPTASVLNVSQIVYSGEVEYFSGFQSGTVAASGGTQNTLVRIPLAAVSPFVGMLTIQSDDAANPNYDVLINAVQTITLGLSGLAGALPVVGDLEVRGGRHQRQDVSTLTI